MAEVKKFIRIRAGHRGDVTKRIAAAEALMLDFEPSKQAALEALHTVLLEKYGILKEIDAKILDSLLDDEETQDDAIANEVSTATDVDVKIQTIQTTLEKMKKELKWVGDDNDDNVSTSSGKSSRSERERRVKLPKIEIEKFGGDPKRWQEWWDAFKSLIHTNDDLTSYDKFYYLRSYLQGDAKSAVAGLQATDVNYLHAIDILKERFGKKSLVISSHMEALMKVTTLTDDDNTRKIRRVYDKIECHIRSLQALGLDSANYGCVLGPVILSHLPDELRLSVTRKFDATADVWELNDILVALKSEIEVRERSGFVASNVNNNNKDNNNTKRNNNDGSRQSGSALYTNDKTKDDAPPVNKQEKCLYCSGKHATVSCKTVTDIEARRQILRKKARCFNCFGGGHIAGRCRNPKVCGKCDGKHDTSLCDEPLHKDPEPEKKEEEEKKDGITMHCNTATSVLMLTARASVCNVKLGKPVSARVIFDNCSNRTYVTDCLRQTLKLPKIGVKKINISRFMDTGEGKEKPVIHDCDIVQLMIKGVNDEDIIVSARTVPAICPPPNTRPIEFYKKEFRHLRTLTLADEVVQKPYRGNQIDMMIGLDYYYDIIYDQTERGVCGPVATKSRVGWLVAGPVYSKTDEDVPELAMTTMCTDEPRENLDELVRNFWSLEAMGITEEDSNDVLRRFEESIWFNNETQRYSVSLPWRQMELQLSDNFQLCMKYMLCRLKEFKKNPSLFADYNAVFDDQIESGVVEEVPDEPPPVGKVYYIPHHCVIRPDRATTKLRVVLNASSSVSGPTLNQCLHKGPSLMPELVRILLGLRCHRIAVIGDLEKAFLNIEIDEKDRDYLRTVWVKNFDPNAETDIEFVKLRYTRCVFGVSSSPFHLMATTKHHTDKYREKYPKIVTEIQRSLFVDDLNSGADTVSEGYELYTVGKKIFKDAGMNLRKFATNSAELRAKIALDENLAEVKADVNESSYVEIMQQSIEQAKPVIEQKLLGMIVNWEADCWVYKFDALLEIAKSIKRTKQGLLRLFPRIFDPPGLVSPIVLPLKVMFQNTCVEGLKWDEKLSADQIQYIDTWLQNLKEVGEIRFPRYILRFPRSQLQNVQLVGFSDASSFAFGAVIYVRVESEDGVDVNVLFSKSRVAPVKKQKPNKKGVEELKKLTIPRLELLGCLCLAKLMCVAKEVIQQYVTIDNVSYYTDSMTALCWILNDFQQYKQFVEERAIKIRKLSENWKHVKGTENPADLTSRGLFATQLKDNLFWMKGAEWLMLPPEKWPVKERDVDHTEESIKEMRVEDQKKAEFTCASIAWNCEEVIDSARFSSFRKLLRVTAYVQRFIHNTRYPAKKIAPGEPSPEELMEAEIMWIQTMQERLKSDPKYSNLERQLSIYKDEEGILRSKGRLEKSQLIYNQKHPIVLPPRHPVVRLIIWDAHDRVLHSGVNDTMAYIRETFGFLGYVS